MHRDDLTGFLRGKELLILLDNFEHLLAAAPTVSSVLAAAGGLRVLVTSRAPLHVSGEQEYRLEPLAEKDAAALFVERARAVGREVVPDATVEEICRGSTGSRLPSSSPPRARSFSGRSGFSSASTRLCLSSRAARVTLPTGSAPCARRSSGATTCSTTMPDDCSPPYRCSPAASPSTGAEEVCDADLDVLSSLVDSSLLKPIAEDRLLMLETIREYARERLDAAGRKQLRQRHAAFFSAVAEQAYEHRFEAEAEWSARVELDHDDFRAALDWLSATDPDRALELAGGLGWFWLSHAAFSPRAAAGWPTRSQTRPQPVDAGASADRIGRARCSPRGSRRGPASSKRQSSSGASSATRTSLPRRSTPSVGLSSTTPATRQVRWRPSRRASSFVASSATPRGWPERWSASARCSLPSATSTVLSRCRRVSSSVRATIRAPSTSRITSSPTAR